MTPQRIPANLIIGFLGVGKTTAIRHLMTQRPAGERWAILINEFGKVAIDQTLVEPEEGTPEGAIAIKELAGGCLCCTLGVLMESSIIELLRQAKPDRLLIEPTGLGHPARIIEMLQGRALREAIEPRATLCLVDPRQYRLFQAQEEPIPAFEDQIQLADVLVANKIDQASPEDLDHFKQDAAKLFPPKAEIAAVKEGRVDVALLEAVADATRTPLFPESHGHHKHKHEHGHNHNHNHDHGHGHAHDHDHEPTPAEPLPEPAPGQPVRLESKGLGHHGCGWIFSIEDRFDMKPLGAYLASLGPLVRLKGVFRVRGGRLAYNRVQDDPMQVLSSAYRRESRLEIISGSTPLDWAAIEAQLLALRLPERTPRKRRMSPEEV